MVIFHCCSNDGTLIYVKNQTPVTSAENTFNDAIFKKVILTLSYYTSLGFVAV